MTHTDGDDEMTAGTPGAPEPANGHEAASQRLAAATDAVSDAMRTAQNQGPAAGALAQAVLQVLKYAELLGIQLNELADTYRRESAARAAAAAGREFAELSELVEQAAPLLRAAPDEIAHRLDRIKSGSEAYLDPAPAEVAGTTHKSTLMLPMQSRDIDRLVAAANAAGLSVVEFATTAVLDAIAVMERGKPEGQ